MARVPSSVPVMVTGASSGIGEEFARRFAARGHHVTLVARREDRLARLAEHLRSEHGVTAEILVADLEQAEDRTRVAAVLRNGPWILVNNAGFGMRGAFAELDAERQLGMVTLNVLALTELTAAVLPGNIAARQGGVINVASTAAFQPLPYMAGYAATKAYVLAFTEGLAGELRGTGVRATALCPGATRTEFTAVADISDDEAKLLLPMSAAAVVRKAIAAFDRSRAVRVTGAHNIAGAISLRLVPRAAVRRIVAPLFKPRAGSHHSPAAATGAARDLVGQARASASESDEELPASSAQRRVQ